MVVPDSTDNAVKRKKLLVIQFSIICIVIHKKISNIFMLIYSELVLFVFEMFFYQKSTYLSPLSITYFRFRILFTHSLEKFWHRTPIFVERILACLYSPVSFSDNGQLFGDTLLRFRMFYMKNLAQNFVNNESFNWWKFH
jgi:hypothetical protein